MEISFIPGWLLARLRVPADVRSHWALLISALLIALLAPLAVYIPHFCLLERVLGVPCPGCGVCHSILALLRMDIHRAWQANPAGIAVAAMLAFQILARPVALLHEGARRPVTLASKSLSTSVLVCLLFVWILRLSIGGIRGSYFLLKM